MRRRSNIGWGVLFGALSLLVAAPASAQKHGTHHKKGVQTEDNPYADPAKADQGKAAGEEAGKAGQPPGGAQQSRPETAESGGPAATRGEAMRLYQQALVKRRLAATAPLSRQRLRDVLEKTETKISDGRLDEAIGDLVYIVESPRFDPFKESDEGRASLFWLGDSLGRVGAYQPARGYLVRLLKGDPKDTWYRRAVRSLVDFGLESDQPDTFLKDLSSVPSSAPEELRGDIAYLAGRAAERRRDPAAALGGYAKVTPRSRFWAQATYLSGLIEVERGQLKKGENLFCKVADPKQTPKKAPLFGGNDFFRVRDLARLALGRVAHEQFRFDDSRYYYYLVPQDSDHLPEALYEAATSRYEAKDYDGARELMDQLEALHRNNPYQDEAWILDAYIDLATCHFPAADKKLQIFLARYEPVRNAARRLTKDPAAMNKLVEAVRSGADPAGAGVGVKAGVARTLGALLRLDAGYSHASLRLARLDHEMSGLRGAMGDLAEANKRLATPKSVRAQSATPLGEAPSDKITRIDAQLAEVRRLLREVSRTGKAKASDIAELSHQLEALEVQAHAARAAAAAAIPAGEAGGKGTDLPDVIRADRQRASRLYENSAKLRAKLAAEQQGMARDALVRLDRRLSRLLRRARLGRVETVLGKKRALEVEIEALSQGLLPRTIVDSLDAARYLRDDEEYWPYDGEDWKDEYVGGEGLR